MAFGRRRNSLLGTAARAAVITGTVSATSNAVNGRAARAQQAAAAQAAPAAAAPAAPAAAPNDDVIAKLERLAALHATGALTDDEFAALKASTLS